jgi:hypothetical protein
LVTGGTPPYSYAWFPNPPVGQGTSTISSLCINNYTLVVADATGCSSNKLISVGSGVGIFEVESLLSGVDIFPNPAAETINISLPKNSSESFVISISNILGEELLIMNSIASAKLLQIDFSAFAPGTYFVKVSDESGKSAINKIVKQ